ncbi:MAG: hypothetical protein ACREEP_21740 [Dongiaceae bacterium]
MEYDERKKHYRDAITEHMNSDPHLFTDHAFASRSSQPHARLASAAVPRFDSGNQWQWGAEIRKAQELLIIPGRPWWMFWRPPQLEPPTGYPRPPGWTPEWQWRYPDKKSEQAPRWFDPKGGEFRWHPPDRNHPDGHWDYNPWHRWNDRWRNVVPPREGPFGVPPVSPPPGPERIWA